MILKVINFNRNVYHSTIDIFVSEHPPIFNDVIRDSFYYKNHPVYELEVFKNVNICAKDVYVSFYSGGIKKYGYLTAKKTILDQSEEIECKMIVQKFLEEANYIIEIYDHYLSVETISNRSQLLIRPNSSTQSSELSFTTFKSQTRTDLNRTTENPTQTTKTIQRSLVLETNNITEAEHFLLFRNFYNDINDYVYLSFIFFENIMFLFLATKNKIKRFVKLFLEKHERPDATLKTQIKDAMTSHAQDAVHSQVETQNKQQSKMTFVETIETNMPIVEVIETKNSCKQKCSCKGSCDKKNCSCFKSGVYCNENCHNGDHKNCLNIF